MKILPIPSPLAKYEHLPLCLLDVRLYFCNQSNVSDGSLFISVDYHIPRRKVIVVWQRAIFVIS